MQKAKNIHIVLRVLNRLRAVTLLHGHSHTVMVAMSRGRFKKSCLPATNSTVNEEKRKTREELAPCV